MPFRTSTIDSLGIDDAQQAAGYRTTVLGPVVLGDVAFTRSWAVECDDVGSGYFVHMPLAGRFDSVHRGVRLGDSRAKVPVYRPGGGSFRGRWQAGSRSLCVRLAPGAVEEAFARLLGDAAPGRITCEPAMNTAEGLGRSWADLVVMLSRQQSAPDGFLSQPLVAAPLAESVLNGFLLASTRSRTASPAAARPAVVRAAIELIEADPRAPLTVAVLAEHCGVGVRTLQHGFRRHLGLSPMAHVRAVRLQRAHAELIAADPFAESVGAVARRWGFGHLGRFAAAHEERYGQTPMAALRSPG